MDIFSLAGKVALITGAGQGIGAAMARTFAKAGAAVVVNDLREPNAERVAGEIRDAGGKAVGLGADVSDPSAVHAMVLWVAKQFGPVGILVNNAAVYPMQTFDEQSVESWEQHLRINLSSAFYCSKAVAPMMKEMKWGKILNIASVTFLLGAGNSPAYVAAKGGIVGLTRNLAHELGPYNICVNALSPGLVDTEGCRQLMGHGSFDQPHLDRIIQQQCIQRHLQPQDMANVALFLVSPASDSITGQMIEADAGWMKH
jgi:3-oxoacyl-[acyl-carrier protein] reductase